MYLRGFSKGQVEAATVVLVYILFLIVGLHTQAIYTVEVEILAPSDRAQLQSTPVELVAIIRNQKGPLSNATATIMVVSVATGGAEELTGATDGHGIVRVLFPAQSGNYSWYVATKLEGYPTILSRPRSFSTRVALIVDCLYPCSSRYPLFLRAGDVGFRVMVTDMNGRPIESANVTFYVNSAEFFSTMSNERGMATVSWSKVPPGNYAWFASASQDHEFGASRLSSLIVA